MFKSLDLYFFKRNDSIHSINKINSINSINSIKNFQK